MVTSAREAIMRGRDPVACEVRRLEKLIEQKIENCIVTFGTVIDVNVSGIGFSFEAGERVRDMYADKHWEVKADSFCGVITLTAPCEIDWHE